MLVFIRSIVAIEDARIDHKNRTKLSICIVLVRGPCPPYFSISISYLSKSPAIPDCENLAFLMRFNSGSIE